MKMCFEQVSKEEWNSFLKETSHTIFHTFEWMKLMDNRDEFWILKGEDDIER